MDDVTAAGWAAHELAALQCGDRRLAQRSVRVLETLAAHPQASLPAACDSLGEMQALYDLFNNPRVTGEAVLRAHTQATQARMLGHPVVLLIADVSTLDYTDKTVAQELGYIGDNTRRGFCFLPTLAVTPDGAMLGLADSVLYERTALPDAPSRTRKHLPIEAKETRYILQAYQQACQLQQTLPATQLLFVFDRGGDCYELYQEHAHGPWTAPADFLIRGRAQDRCLDSVVTVGGVSPTTRSKARRRKLSEVFAAAPVLGHLTFTAPATATAPARQVTQELRAVTVTLHPPTRTGQHLPAVTLQVIWCHEGQPPAGAEPVDWLLYTSLPVSTLAQVEWAIARYLQRWDVELYFKVLKSGCRIEQLYLQTKARLLPAFSFYCVVAWRVFQCVRLGRAAPDLPCTALLTELEWRVLVWQCTKRRPAQPPSLQEAVRLLGRLGGNPGRRGDGAPGIQAIWLGLGRLRDLVLGATAAQALHATKSR